MPSDATGWVALTEQVERLIFALRDNLPAGGMTWLARQVWSITEELSTASQAGEVQSLVACRAGCPHCCVLQVAVLIPEAVAIVAELRATRGADELAELRARLVEHRRQTRWLEDGERARLGIGCPFLDKRGSCSIHPVRPLACRAVTSTDPALCREALMGYAEDLGWSVPMRLTQRLIMDQAFVALGKVLVGLRLDDRSVELISGVLAFLDDAGLERCYLMGEPLVMSGED